MQGKLTGSKPGLLQRLNTALQALNVNAEGDGHGAQRTLSSPLRRHGLALAWPAILGIILGGLVVIGLTSAVFARRRTRLAYQVRIGLCCSRQACDSASKLDDRSVR